MERKVNESQTIIAPAPARAQARGGPVFAADRIGGPDALGRAEDAALLAELALHQGAETPLSVGFLGAAGSGKSFLLNAVLARLEAGDTADLGQGSVSRLVVARVDAATRLDPAAAIAGALHGALQANYAALADEAAHSGRDLHAAAREASERLDAARRSLDGEQKAQADIDARKARLSETVLYEAAGSRIDTYARANRARVDQSLRKFGLVQADAVASYKDIVRDISESGGALPRFSACVRSFWAFRGQTRLIVLAILLAALSWGLLYFRQNREAILPQFSGLGDNAGNVANWITAHESWFAIASWTALGLAGLALLTNIWRAGRLMQPVLKGVSLLRADVGQRRRDLDASQGHVARRIETLRAQADQAARHADEAERRKGSAATPAAGVHAPFSAAGAGQPSPAAFIDAMSGMMDTGAAAHFNAKGETT